MINGTLELIERGFKCLVEGLGDIEAEQFIATINRENFDYTQWRRKYFDKMSDDEYLSDIVNSLNR